MAYVFVTAVFPINDFENLVFDFLFSRYKHKVRSWDSSRGIGVYALHEIEKQVLSSGLEQPLWSLGVIAAMLGPTENALQNVKTWRAS